MIIINTLYEKKSIIILLVLIVFILSGCVPAKEYKAGNIISSITEVPDEPKVTELPITELPITELPIDSKTELHNSKEGKPSEPSDDNSNIEDNEIIENNGIIEDRELSALHINGIQIVDEYDNPVVLRGVSTHGLQWYPQYVNEETFRYLRDNWNVNLIRLAMYTDEGGYCTGANKEEMLRIIDNGVNYANNLDMYAIIDWHILKDGDPIMHMGEAIDFFNKVSTKYANNKNVIYEICNEPNNVTYENSIKPYADEVIRTIRSNDSDALIIVGTPQWSQYIDEVIPNRINDDNVIYAVHFYAATHREELRDKVVTALESGIPVIISECSICNADGNQNIDYSSGEEWMKLINKYQLSYVFWNLSNKDESSALLKPSCDKLSGFTEEDLSDTGKYFVSK